MSTDSKPRVGVPFRTAAEEAASKRDRYDHYLQAIRQAGGQPIEVSLRSTSADLEKLAASLDAILLPGSPSDVDPSRYRAAHHSATASADPARERTDFALLDFAFARQKPVLAICYGTQLLNVYLGGSLVQDISSELASPAKHDRKGLPGGADAFHSARIEPRSELARLAGELEQKVNSSHHQSIRAPGRGLRVTARAEDGVIEAVEWTADASWVVGVQWHPERMPGHALSEALFRQLVLAAAGVPQRAR